jgi:hypothetical protein
MNTHTADNARQRDRERLAGANHTADEEMLQEGLAGERRFELRRDLTATVEPVQAPVCPQSMPGLLGGDHAPPILRRRHPARSAILNF